MAGNNASSVAKESKEEIEIPPKVTSSRWVRISEEGEETNIDKAMPDSSVKIVLTVLKLDGKSVSITIIDEEDKELKDVNATVSGTTATSDEVKINKWVGKKIKIRVKENPFEQEYTGAELEITNNGKIVNVEWCNNENKTIKEISYNDPVVIKVTTENLNENELSISILEDKVNKKVEDWDKATENDIVLKVTADNNVATVEFVPKDEWFSKRAKDKPIMASVSYGEGGTNKSSLVLTVKRVNYNKDMTVSDNGIRFTAQEEALAMICPDGKIRAYKDTRGNWTIGYGEMTGITADTVLASKEEAFNRYKDKIKGSYQTQARYLLFTQGVKRKMEQYEFDAIVDLVYNSWSCGEVIGKIADEEEISEQTFVNFRGSGLTNRRKAEYMLYTNQVTSVKGPKEYHRKDNTNGGYDDITKQVQETQKVVKDGKTIEEPVFETVEGKQVPKMKTITEQGWYLVNSQETYTLQY